MLTARRKTKLDDIAAACREAGVAVDVIAADLGKPGSARSVWETATANRPVDILINNAGFGYFRELGSIEWERDAELLQLNIVSLVELSYLMVAARGRGPGAGERAHLVNIASIGAYQSVPCMASYAASKAYVRNFTEALHDELRGERSPLSATCVCPGGTTTEFHATAGAGNYGWIANHSMSSAELVAKATLRAMQKGKRCVIPGLVNKLSCWGVRLVPRRFASWMARRILGKPRAGALPSRDSSAA